MIPIESRFIATFMLIFTSNAVMLDFNLVRPSVPDCVMQLVVVQYFLISDPHKYFHQRCFLKKSNLIAQTSFKAIPGIDIKGTDGITLNFHVFLQIFFCFLYGILGGLQCHSRIFVAGPDNARSGHILPACTYLHV